MLVGVPEPRPEAEGVLTLDERSEEAGTELDVGYAIGWSTEASEEARALEGGFASWARFA